MVYECGNGSWVFMYPTPNAGTSKASTAFWSVDDVAAEVAELKARGVVFEEYDFPGLKTENRLVQRYRRKYPGHQPEDCTVTTLSILSSAHFRSAYGTIGKLMKLALSGVCQIRCVAF